MTVPKRPKPDKDQMTILIANSTPYVIWRVSGGLVGACRTTQQAVDLMRDLKAEFPDRDYICRDVDGDLCGDTRVMNPAADGQSPGE